MKTLLANPPWYRDDLFGVRAGSRWPHFQGGSYLPFPFFLSYGAALLEKNGKEVLALDAIAERLKNDAFIEKIKDYSPDLLLMEVSTPSIYDDLGLAKRIKETLPDMKIAFCGPHVIMYEERFLEENESLDFVLYGEYEYTLLKLVEKMETGSTFENLEGLIYRNKNGVSKNPPGPLIDKLDELPWPARHFFPLEKYCDSGFGVPGPSLQMWASRGCPFGCIFCFWPQVMYGGRKYRTRNPADVADEIRFCLEKYDFKSYFFDDDTFNIGKDRIISICKEIEKREIKLPWAVMARADTMDFETLETMRKAGLRGIKYGVESGVQEIVDRSCKPLSLDKVREIVRFTKELGIHVHLSFTFGLPGETKETMAKTVDFALETDPHTLQFSIMTPFPGSDYFDLLDREGNILTKDWSKYDGGSSAVMKTECLTPEDLESAIKRAEELWRSHTVKRDFKDNKIYYLKKGIMEPQKTIKVLKDLLFRKKGNL